MVKVGIADSGGFFVRYNEPVEIRIPATAQLPPPGAIAAMLATQMTLMPDDEVDQPWVDPESQYAQRCERAERRLQMVRQQLSGQTTTQWVLKPRVFFAANLAGVQKVLEAAVIAHARVAELERQGILFPALPE